MGGARNLIDFKMGAHPALSKILGQQNGRFKMFLEFLVNLLMKMPENLTYIELHGSKSCPKGPSKLQKNGLKTFSL